MNIDGAVSVNVKFLNGTSATFYVDAVKCLESAASIAHACEWVALYANDTDDSSFFADLLEGY